MASVFVIHSGAQLSLNFDLGSFFLQDRFPNLVSHSPFSIGCTPSRVKISIPSLQLSTAKRATRSWFCLKAKRSDESYPSKEATFDLKLPRRNLIVQFTCNVCGERTQRKINRVAFERGTVFVQCAGCLANHKLVDNLGLVVEYDLQNEVSSNGADSPP